MTQKTFEQMVKLAESGTEVYTQSFAAGYTGIWYNVDDAQYQVQYDNETGEPESIQEVGTTTVVYAQ